MIRKHNYENVLYIYFKYFASAIFITDNNNNNTVIK